jgi:hypothetical protein
MKVVFFRNETMSNLTVDYMEMQSKNKTSKNSTAALIYLLKSDIEKNFNQKYRYMNAKYLILPFFFLSSLSIAQETNPSANKSGSSFR